MRCQCPDTGLWNCECEDPGYQVTLHNYQRIPMQTNHGNHPNGHNWGIHRIQGSYTTVFDPKTGNYYAGTPEEIKDQMNSGNNNYLPLLVLGLFLIMS
jgi:hypothetical protein